MDPSFGLHRLSDSELKRLLRALHRGVLPSPVTRSALIEKAFGHIEGHLDLIVGLEVAAAKAIVVAVLGERSERGNAATLAYSGLPLPGTRSRDTVALVRELLASAKSSVQLYGVRVGDDRGLLTTVRSLMAGRDVRVRLVFDGRELAQPSDEVRAFVLEKFPSRVGLELFVAVRPALRARVVVVDDARVLVTSSELSGCEEDGCLDVGAQFGDSQYVSALRDEWQRLVASGEITAIPLD